mmetsp:Transcript_122176/g.223993  ORF Transcript_122176/g.223993 Transcript_122176/m.223993 type:complete len:222 (-) Transcript_122176:159-824(-)
MWSTLTVPATAKTVGDPNAPEAGLKPSAWMAFMTLQRISMLKSPPQMTVSRSSIESATFFTFLASSPPCNPARTTESASKCDVAIIIFAPPQFGTVAYTRQAFDPRQCFGSCSSQAGKSIGMCWAAYLWTEALFVSTHTPFSHGWKSEASVSQFDQKVRGKGQNSTSYFSMRIPSSADIKRSSSDFWHSCIRTISESKSRMRAHCALRRSDGSNFDMSMDG